MTYHMHLATVYVFWALRLHKENILLQGTHLVSFIKTKNNKDSKKNH